jgi:two-component system NtrC family sensor kinase
VFVRQRLLDLELLRLLNQSRESFVNLKRLQTQITESEKLASIGHLLGGAAHELNNPITAMLGYSDLLVNTPLNAQQGVLAAGIGQQIRRTKSLVSSLLSFAKPTPAAMVPVNLNTVLRTAIKLSQPQWLSLKIEVQTELQLDLPPVLGDSNQLLQVCVQILSNAVHAADQLSNRNLNIATQHRNGIVSIYVSDGGLGPAQEAPPASEAADEPLASLGLSACRGILLQHHGKILWRESASSGTSIRVELPAMSLTPQKGSSSGAPAMWQTQPFA